MRVRWWCNTITFAEWVIERENMRSLFQVFQQEKTHKDERRHNTLELFIYKVEKMRRLGDARWRSCPAVLLLGGVPLSRVVSGGACWVEWSLTSRALASRNPEWTDRAETLNPRLTRQAPGEQKVPNRRHAQTKKIHDTRYLFYRLGRNMYLKKK